MEIQRPLLGYPVAHTAIEIFKSHQVEVLHFWTSHVIFLTEIVGLYFNLNLQVVT